MMKRLVLLVVLCGLLAGCGEPGSAKEKPVEQVIPPLGRLPELPQSYTPPPSTEKKPEPAPQPAPQPVPSQPPVTVTQTVAPAPAPQPAITIPLPRGF